MPWLAAVAVTAAAILATVPLAFGTTEGANTVVDPNTSNNWSSIATNSTDTQNVGRIWTDKSVFNGDYKFEGSLQGQSISKGDSDFLVSLSAMSSTSNVRSMVTRTQPLDIVLIIDRSSSMREDIEQAGSYTEVPAGSVEEADGYLEWHDGFMGFGRGNEAHQTSGVIEYYALVDGEYVRINEETTTHYGDGWYSSTSYEEHIRWTLNGQTVTPEDTQFYEYQQGGTTSRMEALKTAANNFIDSAAGLPNPEQVRIGVVSFAGTSEGNTASIDQQFTNLSGNNAQTLKNTVNGINAPSSGAGTYPANAFQDAQSMFNGSAQGTQKVVVFFTDGGPGGGSDGWSSWDIDNSVANSAINAAHGVKANGATIYSVGVLDDADPTIDVSNVSSNSPESLRINAFMHAVSSNYPNATGFTSDSIGSRAQNSDYYKAATNASELNNIFNDIFKEIESNQGSGSPIEEETHEGAANTPGDLVFEDQLGSYMQVTGEKMTLVYADGKHESVRSETQGNITTYYFEGTFAGNAIYGAADYSGISVQVEHSTNLATGDKVTVTIPANLIPMRSYNVDTESETPTMTITDAYPVRLFYGVSLKQGAVNAINAGSGADYDAIMSSQVSENGTIDFYSNAFASNAPNGLTTATFTPNEANRFYYYTQDTTLYIDQDCTIPATSWNSSDVDTFYYAEPYWERKSDGTAVEHTGGVAITRSSLDFQSVQTRRGQLYIPAHTARQDRPHTLDVTKNPNSTGTASSVLVPSWNGVNQSVTQSLGNNGKLSLPAPGSLQISKTVDWGNASDQTKVEKNSFTFHINLTDASGSALTGNYSYTVTGTGAAEGQGGTISDGGEITLADGQTATITGLPNGAKFEVVENMVSAFTIIDNVGDTTDRTAEGTIASGETATVAYTNRYHANPVDLSDAGVTLSAHKELQGRDWREDDVFRFLLSSNDLQMNARIVDITDQTSDHTAAFRDVTFDAPGTYTLTITEDNDYEPVIGINYSGATFTVTVEVEDDGEGQLYIPENGVSIEQTRPDREGAEMNGVDADTNTVTFVNTYDATNDEVIIDGTKLYTDTTGKNPITTDKFTFQIEAVGGYKTDDSSVTVAAEDVPMPASAGESNISTTNIDALTETGGAFQFDAIPFDGDNVGYTYTYRVTEVAGSAEQGMQYNTTNASYELTIAVTEDASHVIATPSLPPSDIVFENVYDPTDAALSGDAAIHGTKTLTGRDLNDGEQFYFTLTQTGGPATLDPDDDADAYTVVLSQPETVAVDSLTNGSADFNFSDLSFPQIGTYTFTVDETTADGSDTTDGNGLTYSQNVATVTVEVTDGGEGTLVATATYSNRIGNASDKAAFTNVYESSMDYGAGGAGGINVTKQLNGRPMTADEFTFNVTGQGDAADMTTDLDREFKNTGAAEGETITMEKLQSLTFDQDDAGKTFSFIVDEVEGDQSTTKIDYDQSQYRVDITVYDDGLGNMHAVTNVTRIMDTDGNTVSEPVVTDANSGADGYEVPTFGFVNTYTPDPVVVGEDTQDAIQVTKTVTGAPSPDGVNYGFTMTLTSDNADGITSGMTANGEGKLEAHVATSGTIAADSSQTVSFGNITFSKPGTYTFDVTEDALAADEGWSYDTVNTGAKTVTLVVSSMNEQGQYDGSLHIDSVTGNPVQVTNAYKPGEVIVGGDGAAQQITVQKTVTGADSTADYTFQLEPVVNEGDEEKWGNVELVDSNYNGQATVSGGVTTDQSKTANFGGIKFKQAGEYQFKITEVGADQNVPAGWTYDTHESFATVSVIDTDFDGYLEASVSYDNKKATTDADKGVNNAAAFTNSYKADPATLTGDEANFNGTKLVEGRGWLEGETFGFTMTPSDEGTTGDWDNVSYKANDEAEAVAVGENSATATANGNESVAFWFPGTYTFNEAGTYVFNVTETSHNGNNLPNDGTNGMTYDRHTGVITVTVEDNGQGQLVANAVAGTVAADAEDGTATENDMSFENYYTPTPVVYGDEASEILGGNKNVEDHSGSYVMADDQFTFMMRAQAADNPMPEGLQTSQDDQGRPIVSVTNKNTNAQNNTATFDFGEITFTKAGTYQYNIYENETSMPAGVSPQDSGRTYTITFKVTENTATGELTVDASAVLIGSGDQENTPVQLNEINFVNEYNATATSGSTQIFKTLNGRNWQQGDTFTFDVSMTVDGVAADEMPTFNFDNTGATVNDFTSEAGKLSYNVTITPSTSATGNTYAFSTGTATYTHEGTYVYTITERDIDSSVVNVTKDAAVYTVTVEVTNVNNALQRTVTIARDGKPYTETGRVDFTNTYTPTASEGVPANFALQKTFIGHEWTNDYAFGFVLSPDGDAPMPKEDQNAGVTIDEAGNAHKTINAPTGDSKDTATFDFGAISYDKAGTYKYTVTEVKGNHGGVTYDTDTVNITVEVKDVAGQLVATATVTGSFTNTYKTSAEYNAGGAGGLDITKQVTNHAMADDQFSFTITAADEASAKKLGITDGTTATVNSAESDAGVATSVKSNPFETVSFDKSDDGVTYTYTIAENGTTGEGEYKNYVLDDTTYEVKITATDDGDGTMTVKTVVNGTEYSNQRATVDFVNSYNADPTTVGAKGDATIKGTKTLKNDDIANYTGENAFKFEVKSGDVVVAEGTNDANGNITFGDITYTTENLAAAATAQGSPEVGTATVKTTDSGTEYTFNYTVSEVNPDPNQTTGVTANSGSQNVTVTVTDDGNGKLMPEVTYGDGDPLAFENIYGGDANYPLVITGTKEIVGAQDGLNVPTLNGGEYEFTITGTPAADGTPAPMPAVTTAKNDAAGGVTFEAINYTMENTFGSTPATTNADAENAADETTTDEAATDEGIETYTAGRTKEFTYTISESGSVAGVTNEQGTKTVTVKVTDLGGGDIKAEVTSEKTAEGAGFKFTNVYDVTPEDSSLTGDGGFTITKDFTSTNTGRTLAEGDFTFELKGKDGSVVKSAKNAADGTVSFEGITFTKPGTYEYTLSELNEGKPGVTYDNKIYNVTATVEDQGNGTLEVRWEMPQAADSVVTFKNTYTAENGSITLKAAKVLQGRDLADGEFTFELRENGKVIDTATNNAAGEVAFDTIEYTEPGEHDYEIVEVAGTAEGVTYDMTVHTMHVSVTDNPNTGKLEVNWAYGENGAPVFTNTYTEPAVPVEPGEPTEPAKPADNLPVTGDYTLPIVGGIVVAGAALIIGGRVMKKRGE